MFWKKTTYKVHMVAIAVGIWSDLLTTGLDTLEDQIAWVPWYINFTRPEVHTLKITSEPLESIMFGVLNFTDL